MNRNAARGARGMTLVELMFVVAITSVVIAGLTKATIDLMRTNRVRTLNVELQGEGRDALRRLERDVRQAALGVPIGGVWTQDGAGNVVQRPAVQILDNVGGGGTGVADAKPGTDALLIVSALPNGAESVARGTQYSSTAGLQVASSTAFNVGDFILVGPYREAAWDRIGAIAQSSTPAYTTFTLGSTQNVFPKGKADSGSMVREARALLYYVNTLDELVVAQINRPLAPPAAANVLSRQRVASGVEDLQLDCEIDTGVALAACPAAGSNDATITAEGVTALGPATGSRLNTVNVPTLRTVILSVVVRSRTPIANQSGDAAIALGNQSALGDTSKPYLRRAYRVAVAVRNVSLGAL